MNPLNHQEVALCGTNLVEAGAGTGKTWAITALYLRLLLEKELLPEEILVVTFTEAATEELRSRLRLRIREALDFFTGRGSDDDPFLQELCRRHREEAARAEALLVRALSLFDTAAVFTIHAFCLRVLEEHAFESGTFYNTTLLSEQSDLSAGIIDDFWRESFFSGHPLFLAYALREGCTPEALAKLVSGLHAGDVTLVVPVFTSEEIAAVEAKCRTSFGELRAIWKTERHAITALLRNHNGLSRAKDAYGEESLDLLFSAMERFLSSGNEYDLFDAFALFTADELQKKTRKGRSAPEHRFFDCCQTLRDCVRERLLAFKSEAVRYWRRQLPLQKRRHNVRFFDDLLADLHQALMCGERGDALVAALRKRYPAALIDEFQDTDPLQYDIFKAIYAETDLPLFLIGDPKQAIYSFRGADIFTSLKAFREVAPEKRFTLTSNRRSSTLLLRAFNRIFGGVERPFVFPSIRYHELEAERPETGKEEIPLQIRFLSSGIGERGWSSARAQSLASIAAAREIAALLNTRRYGPEEVAVIVRTNRQAGIMREALAKVQVPGVLRSGGSVFATREAREIHLLLTAITEPRNETAVRNALVTELLGRSGSDIAALLENEDRWAFLLQRFHEWHRIWLEHGVMVMSRSLLFSENVPGRLLAMPNRTGERSLTDVFHCFELLHQAATRGKLSMEELCRWLSERIAHADSAVSPEEEQIRLETDEAAVKIVTVHLSKGLQYPVVFCPFLWLGFREDYDFAEFHRQEERVRDFGSRDFQQNRSLAAKESLAESLRLLYVAMTRAEERCVLFTGKIRYRKDTVPSPVAYLLHASDASRLSDDPLGEATRELAEIDEQAMLDSLAALAGDSGGSIGFSTLLSEELENKESFAYTVSGDRRGWRPECRIFVGTVSDEWRIASFTSFSRHPHTPVELPDRDEIRSLPQTDGEGNLGRTIFTFPRGARAGVFMHWVFEQLDFSAANREHVRRVVTDGLERYGFCSDWEPVVAEMVQHALQVPFASSGESFTLSSVTTERRLTEMQFFLPLRPLTSGILVDLLASAGVLPGGADLSRAIERLDFKPVKGMLTGFIDLVFEADGRYWLLDWKSNHLGGTPDAYRPDCLARAMEQHLYTLQYLLYTVALHRYLSLRVEGYSYSTHFGGVLYVFLRGVDSGAGESRGIYRELPPEALVMDLAGLLSENGTGDEDDS